MLNSLVNNARKYFNPQLIKIEMTKKIKKISLHFVPFKPIPYQENYHCPIISFFSHFKVFTYEKK